MTSAAPGASSAAPDEPVFRRLLRATEVDTRMLGMIFALLLIWFGFNVYTQIQTGEGLFLTPRNLWNLSVQTSSIAIMGTGMVLVIVMRHIDLSVGSIIGFVSTIIGVAQARVFPVYLGFDNPTIWILAVLLALVIGAAIGAIHGSLVAYVGIPAFIVTLGGQLFWRGAAWLVTTGQTIAPLDERFALMGGGPHGSVGATASWAIAVLACAGIVFSLYAGRQRRARFRFPQRPMWAEYLIAVVGCLVVLGATTIVNAYPWPERVAATWAEAHHIPVPEGGLFISTGWAIPVLIALAIGFVMTFIARRTQFGRYVYATGGNPEAAELAGINTKHITVMVFALDGHARRSRSLHQLGAARFGDQRARPARRALYDRGGSDRRHVARRRRRHHLRRADRRARHSVAAVGHGAARLRLGLPGDGGRPGAGRRGRPRQLLSPQNREGIRSWTLKSAPRSSR